MSAIEPEFGPRPHHEPQLLATADEQFLASFQLMQQVFGLTDSMSIAKQLRNQPALPRDLKLGVDHMLLRQCQVLKQLGAIE